MLQAIVDGLDSPGREPSCFHAPELFFAEKPEAVEKAKALCRVCPFRVQCLAGAIRRREPWGVWGGELLDRGVIIARKRARGRPRKVDVAA